MIPCGLRTVMSYPYFSVSPYWQHSQPVFRDIFNRLSVKKICCPPTCPRYAPEFSINECLTSALSLGRAITAETTILTRYQSCAHPHGLQISHPNCFSGLLNGKTRYVCFGLFSRFASNVVWSVLRRGGEMCDSCNMELVQEPNSLAVVDVPAAQPEEAAADKTILD